MAADEHSQIAITHIKNELALVTLGTHKLQLASPNSLRMSLTTSMGVGNNIKLLVGIQLRPQECSWHSVDRQLHP